MADQQSRTIGPEEIRRDTEAMVDANPNDILVWLEAERNLEAVNRHEAFAVDDKVKANRHDERTNRFAAAVRELTKARERLATFTEVLCSRIEVALVEAKQPAWVATHLHYKGTLYRVTGMRNDANGQELVEGIDYDDAAGNRYYLHRSRFESVLESGRPRYQVLYK